VKIALNLSIFFISFSWYSLVAVLISSSWVLPVFLSLQVVVQGLLRGLRIYFGVGMLPP